jgi:hypothetical protein
MTDSDFLAQGDPLNLTEAERANLAPLEGEAGPTSEWVVGESAVREHDGSPGLLPEIDASAYPEGAVSLPPTFEQLRQAAESAETAEQQRAALEQIDGFLAEVIQLDSHTRVELDVLAADLRAKLQAAAGPAA